MMPTTRIMTQQCISHTAPTLTVLVKKYTPCQGVVWSQYRLPGTFYVPLGFTRRIRPPRGNNDDR